MVTVVEVKYWIDVVRSIITITIIMVKGQKSFMSLVAGDNNGPKH